MKYFVFISGPRKGARVRLDRPSFTIGRERTNDIPLEDHNASRKHAELIQREGFHYIRDLHSTNGTILNGATIEDETRLSSGDNILLGDSLLLYKEADGSRQIHAVAFKEDSPEESSRHLVLDPSKSKYLDPTTMVVRPEAAQHLATLYKFIASITPILTTERLANTTLSYVLGAANADRAFIMLLDEDQRLQPAAMKFKTPSSEPDEVQVSRRMTEKVLSTGESILSMDTPHDSRFKDSVAITKNRVTSFICAPLKSSDKILGLVYADTIGMSPPLSEDDLQLLTAMGLLAGAQFGNAQLYGELLNSHEHTQSILRCLRSGIVVTEGEAVVKQVNDAACELLGISEDGLIDHKFDEFQNLRPIWRVIDETIRSGIPSERQEVIIEVHGENVPVGISTSLLRDFENRVRGVVTNFRSLSVIKKLAEQVKMSQHLAALGEMAAGIAHEIRNPLNSIRGFAQLLENFLPTDDQEKADSAKGYINIVIDEVDRMNQLVQDLLDFSRQRELTMAKVDLAKLVQDIIAEMQPDLTQAQAQVDTEFESGLTPVMASAAKLKQVIFNIVRNAIQAMRPPVAPEGRPVRLGLKVRGIGEDGETTAVQVEVSDSGMGINGEAGARIFEPFFTTRERGTGLGLAICRKIVEQHGGMIDFETQTGVGTTMRVTLPVN